MDNTAIVVKINNIGEHSNADKLKIVKLFGTQIIVGLDTKIGDIAVYVDSNLKMSQEFLHANNQYRHYELNDDKTKDGFFDDSGRVKCIKLRGELSDGFLFPLNFLNFTGKNKLKVGDEFNSINGIEICKKYIPLSQQGSGGKQRVSTKKLTVPMFKEHFKTSQFMREQHQIPAGTICYIEEKIHGTSHRTGFVKFPVYEQLPWWKKVLYTILKLKTLTEWMYLNGTRRVVHTPRKLLVTYHDNTMREEILARINGTLLKGEEVYLELFGHEKTGKQVQKGFPYNTESKPEVGNPYRALLYRVTMNNEDGHTVDYNREAVYDKAKELGMEIPHLFEKFYYDGSVASMQTLETKVIEYAQGQSALGMHGDTSDTLKEGVVIWFINSSGHWKALKYKSDAFRLQESAGKDKGIVDQEDTN